MAERSRGGFFGGETSPNTDTTTARQNRGSTTRSRGGAFGGNTASPSVPQETPTVGGSTDTTPGSLFSGGINTTPNIPVDSPAGGTSAREPGGFFTGTGGQIEIEQGPTGAPGRDGADGRGIERIEEEVVGDQVRLTFFYTDGSSQLITYPVGGSAQLPPLLQDFSDALDSQGVNATQNLAIRKPASDDVELVDIGSGGGGGGTSTTFRLVINFQTTTTATINGTTTNVTVDFNADTIAHPDRAIGDAATVEVNGITFFPAVDYMIVNGVLTFTDYELEQGDGDLIVITWMEVL